MATTKQIVADCCGNEPQKATIKIVIKADRKKQDSCCNEGPKEICPPPPQNCQTLPCGCIVVYDNPCCNCRMPPCCGAYRSSGNGNESQYPSSTQLQRSSKKRCKSSSRQLSSTNSAACQTVASSIAKSKETRGNEKLKRTTKERSAQTSALEQTYYAAGGVASSYSKVSVDETSSQSRQMRTSPEAKTLTKSDATFSTSKPDNGSVNDTATVQNEAMENSEADQTISEIGNKGTSSLINASSIAQSKEARGEEKLERTTKERSAQTSVLEQTYYAVGGVASSYSKVSADARSSQSRQMRTSPEAKTSTKSDATFSTSKPDNGSVNDTANVQKDTANVQNDTANVQNDTATVQNEAMENPETDQTISEIGNKGTSSLINASSIAQSKEARGEEMLDTTTNEQTYAEGVSFSHSKVHTMSSQSRQIIALPEANGSRNWDAENEIENVQNETMEHSEEMESCELESCNKEEECGDSCINDEECEQCNDDDECAACEATRPQITYPDGEEGYRDVNFGWALNWDSWEKFVCLLNGDPYPDDPCINRCGGEPCTDVDQPLPEIGNTEAGFGGNSYGGLVFREDPYNQDSYIILVALPLLLLGLMASFKGC